MIYVFDTNSIRILRNYYPQRFPTFWSYFDNAVNEGIVISVREVYKELELQVSKIWIWEWIEKSKSMFNIPISYEYEFVREIFNVPNFKTLIGVKQLLRGQPVADPFIIAAARVQNGCVVTEETEKPNAANIPNICRYFSVSCTNMKGFLEKMDWQF